MNTKGRVVPEESAQAPIVESQPEETTDLRDALIEQLTLERDQFKDQSLRVMAEAQNVQRRLRQQMEENRKYATQPLIERLLPVVDSFERTLMAADSGASLESLLDGVRVIDKQIRQVLEAAKVEKIESVGADYNPEHHEAIIAVESDEHPEDTIMDEIETGYTMHGRVIRPAKVRVSKKP